jgi:Lar family restriction alleviation protein
MKPPRNREPELTPADGPARSLQEVAPGMTRPAELPRSREESVKECPFCGCYGLSLAYPRVIRESACGIVECHTDNCGAMVIADTLPLAIKAWNRRAYRPELTDE